MQIEAQHYLSLAEATGDLVFVDIESTGFKADYDSVLCVSFKQYGKKPFSLAVKQVGNDQKVVREAAEILGSYGCWATYYGKGFDIPFLNTRLLKWRQPQIQQRHHLDMYFTLKPKMALSRKGLGAVARFLNVKTPKLDVGQEVWSEISYKMEHMPTMIERCEGDCITLEEIYKETKYMIKDIKKG